MQGCKVVDVRLLRYSELPVHPILGRAVSTGTSYGVTGYGLRLQLCPVAGT
jgi:hypothetical protein